MKVGVIGAGTMGAGIAQAFAMTDGYEVCLCDIKEEFAEGGKAKILKNLNFLVGKEKISQAKADEIAGKIATGLKDDLVIEVCPEKMSIKKDTFTELMKICKKDCIFASNTSSLSITEMGQGLDRPLIGMHFFNPAPVMNALKNDRTAFVRAYDTCRTGICGDDRNIRTVFMPISGTISCSNARIVSLACDKIVFTNRSVQRSNTVSIGKACALEDFKQGFMGHAACRRIDIGFELFFVPCFWHCKIRRFTANGVLAVCPGPRLCWIKPRIKAGCVPFKC